MPASMRAFFLGDRAGTRQKKKTCDSVAGLFYYLAPEVGLDAGATVAGGVGLTVMWRASGMNV
ncbi:hypothetical protein HIV01_000850 [Lysobacter arenosi]|uniref:Uncharacterized protein n=1 Tax=Lysobacter arenosi TaxID=2795387 RepID=A0ABX7RAI2_9GAMM|nr:hypothetical protein [Lysobacter arenosi]QSX75157.1 hypothetical protein HIV01_000850 [Lysobacter arenosi]